jgi:hypothetical protein
MPESGTYGSVRGVQGNLTLLPRSFKDVFGSFWRPPKGTRLSGRDPTGWQSTAFRINRGRGEPRATDHHPIANSQ